MWRIIATATVVTAAVICGDDCIMYSLSDSQSCSESDKLKHDMLRSTVM